MRTVKVHFAGTGNAFNSDAHLNQSIIIEYDGNFLAVDAGPTFLYGIEKTGLPSGNVNRILLTHFHGDHIAGIPFQLINFAFIHRQTKLFIAGPSGTEKRITQLMDATYPEVPYRDWLEFTEFDVIRKDAIRLTNAFVVDTFPMLHTWESLGYVVSVGGKQIAITGDTRWNTTIPLLMDNRDLGIIECTLVNKGESDHISLEELLEYRHQLHCKTLIALHTDNTVRNEIRRRGVQSIRVIDDGEMVVV
ncbi:MAG TPA: MBL fold metallo-hydrolase [Chitinispirillaceae bacterium]|nr:MBL fold metallo-hydrolase [Chitinispirillaceae bacterium]